MNERTFQKIIKICKKWHKGHKIRRPIHFTFVLDGSKVISMGTNINHRRTHPASFQPFKSVHSELDAILNIKIADECKKYHFTNLAEFASRLDLINVRLLKNGDIAMAKPCKHCQRMIDEIGFRTVRYTTNAEESSKKGNQKGNKEESQKADTTGMHLQEHAG